MPWSPRVEGDNAFSRNTHWHIAFQAIWHDAYSLVWKQDRVWVHVILSRDDCLDGTASSAARLGHRLYCATCMRLLTSVLIPQKDPQEYSVSPLVCHADISLIWSRMQDQISLLRLSTPLREQNFGDRWVQTSCWKVSSNKNSRCQSKQVQPQGTNMGGLHSSYELE